MARTIGKAFKISRNAVRSYGYAKRGMRSNPATAVTAIAAINGRGARRRLTSGERSAFATKLRAARARRMRGNEGTPARGRASSAQLARARENIRRAIAARRSGRGTDMRRNAWTGSPAQRSAALRNLAKARAALRAKRGHSANRRRKHRSNRKRHRRNVWRGDSAGHSAAARKGWARRRGGMSANRRRKHRSNRRRKHRSNRRRKHSANRRRRRYADNRRRKHRSNRRRRRYADNRRRHRRNRRHSANRRRYRSNRGRRLFRRNEVGMILTVGTITAAGFIAHKAVTKVLSTLVFDKLFGAPAAPMEAKPPTPPATSGMEALQPYKGIISGFAAALLGVIATNFVVRDVRTKMFLQAGIATSFMHNVIVTILDKVAPAAAGYLSGFGDFEDSTAARLSAMYGLGASIMPMYKPITQTSGFGEYFDSGVAPTSGLGFADGALGQYGPNPDLYEAAAGFGAEPPPAGSNHILPQTDLDRELTIAEAAAGVGQVAYEAAAGFGEKPFEAAAGIGEYYTDVLPKPMSGLGEYFTEGNVPGMSGFGDIDTVPRADTWIPGMAHPELWAGVRGVARPQASTAMVPAGILQTGGGQGVFG